jgi:dienelactone hydrolase
MIGMLLFLLLVVSETIFLFLQIFQKISLRKQKAILSLSELLLFVILFFSGIVQFSFRWVMLIVLLAVRGILSTITLIKKKQEKPYRLCGAIGRFAGSVLLILPACLPALIFPQYNPLTPSGSYELSTVSYTWTDESRTETFEEDGSNRQVTVQFWYPDSDTEEKFPLVVFSHGAFGFRMSNHSTFAELASNGYVVCSIDHPYHAFFTKQTDGKVITVNPSFLQEAMQINESNASEDAIFGTSQEWLSLRTKDMNFVIDTIELLTRNTEKEEVFQHIDLTKIGVMGHSLGGATSVAIGRQRGDVDAVIDIDGTMLGEELAYENGEYQVNQEPYPVPLLAIDTTDHYLEGLTYGDQYANNVTLANALDGREVHFDQAGHLNFTDLPFFSPTLAGMLGTGNIDRTYCIQTLNHVILNYYNYYLKGDGQLSLQEVY